LTGDGDVRAPLDKGRGEANPNVRESRGRRRFVTDPRSRHAQALEVRRAETEALQSRTRTVGNARVLAALGAIGLWLAIAFARLEPWAWWGVVACIGLFVVLVVVHGRIHARLDRASAAARFHERALARMAGAWKTFSSTGERWASPSHPYASDLDIFGRASLFQRIDATCTKLGEQKLAGWLLGAEDTSTPEVFSDVIRERQAAVRELAPRVELREALSALGSLLVDTDEKTDPQPFVTWAGAAEGKGMVTSSMGMKLVAASLSLATLSTLLLGALGGMGRFFFLLPFSLSVLVLGSLRANVAASLQAASSKEGALHRYKDLLGLVERERFESPRLVQLQARLHESGASATREMRALSVIVGFVDARNNEVFRLLLGPALMWDYWCALALERWRVRAGRAVGAWFESLAELEALTSLAGFSFENPSYVFPVMVTGESAFDARGLGHPLLEEDRRVVNDVAIPGRGHGLVVTGSNMSGKSTLLRAVGINAVLANAGAPVCARALRMGRLVVVTSMRVSDSLEEGTSRFYAELKKLKLVLSMARTEQTEQRNRTVLFLLDEILHGTNTRERLIGARALLRELLDVGAMGCVSTHDLQLGELANERPGAVTNVHFEEQVVGDEMSFDYVMRRGVVQSSNALRLMKIVGLDLPVDQA
jgi:hypothetical protein